MTELISANRAESRRLPGVEGVWVFIAADMAMFGVLFVSFMLERLKNPALFEQSRQPTQLQRILRHGSSP